MSNSTDGRKRKVYLRKLAEADSHFIKTWLSDPLLVSRLSHSTLKISEDPVKWIAGLQDSKTNLVFAVVEVESGSLVGIASIHDIQSVNNVASVGIIIGDSKRHRNGYGTEVMGELLNIAFGKLKLSLISADVVGENKAAMEGLAKCGFQKSGAVPNWYKIGTGRAGKESFYIPSARWTAMSHGA